MSKRILYINAGANIVSGAEHSLAANILSLNNGFEPIIISPFGRCAQFFRENTRAKVIALPLEKVNRRSYFNIIKNRKILSTEILRLAPDIVHTNTTAARIITPKAVCKELIWQIRDMQPLPKILLRELYKKSDKIAVISQAVARYYDLAFTDKLYYLPPTFYVRKGDNFAHAFDKCNPNKITVGLIAQYAKWKRHSLFIEAISRLPKNYLGCIIGAGAAENCGYYEHISQLADTSEQVEVLPYTENISDFFKRISCLVLTSKDEPFGRVIIEAYLSRVPVIALQGGGVNEIVKDNETGILLSCDSPQSIANAIEQITSDVVLKNKIIENAYNFALENFSLTAQRARLNHIYGEN